MMLVKIVSIIRIITLFGMSYFFLNEMISEAIFTGVFILFTSIWLGHQNDDAISKTYLSSFTTYSGIDAFTQSDQTHQTNHESGISSCDTDSGDCGSDGGDGGGD